MSFAAKSKIITLVKLMQKRELRRNWVVAAVAVVLLLAQYASAAAESASSPKYRIEDAQFNAGSQQACSDSYCAQQSAGDTFAGEASSANYSIKFGPNPSMEPQIQVISEGGNQNLGVLDVDRTATATNIVKVRQWSIKGYAIQLSGHTPGQGTHEITPMSAPSTSHSGAEQFGINLVKNTAPEMGADPVQLPANKGNIGHPTDNYGVPNIFTYNDGDIIAESNASDGETHYTLSMILNVSSTTPLGRYGGSFSVIVIPAY